MAEIGKYIYGIINSKEEKIFGPYGIPIGELVYTIPYQDISAVVNDSRVVDYTNLFKDALARLLLNHQKVIERIMNLDYAIIPFKLGTFSVTKEEIGQILAKGYPLIKDVFNKIIDKIEIDVACAWSDFESVIKEIGEQKEIKELKERILANPGRITTDDQMKAGFMVKKALDEKRAGYRDYIEDVLRKAAIDFKAHELMDDKMLINTAFLIDKAKRKNFDEKVEKLNAEFNEKLNFRCVGPLPPYSFYTLEVKKIEFEDLDWARKKLSLTDAISKDELKEAYQKAVFLHHPDKNPTVPDIEKEFDEVVKAYKILGEYTLACKQAGFKERFSFKEEECKRNALLVKIRD